MQDYTYTDGLHLPQLAIRSSHVYKDAFQSFIQETGVQYSRGLSKGYRAETIVQHTNRGTEQQSRALHKHKQNTINTNNKHIATHSYLFISQKHKLYIFNKYTHIPKTYKYEYTMLNIKMLINVISQVDRQHHKSVPN